MGPLADLFTQPVLGAAWKTRPTYYIVGTDDRTIQPDLQRFLAKRMKAKVTELASSHVPMLSQPRRVYEVSREAADAVQQSARQGTFRDERSQRESRLLERLLRVKVRTPRLLLRWPLLPRNRTCAPEERG